MDEDDASLEMMQKDLVSAEARETVFTNRHLRRRSYQKTSVNKEKSQQDMAVPREKASFSSGPQP